MNQIHSSVLLGSIVSLTQDQLHDEYNQLFPKPQQNVARLSTVHDDVIK